MINSFALAVLFITPALFASGGETEANKAQPTQSTIMPLQRAGHYALGISKLAVATSWIFLTAYMGYTSSDEVESVRETMSTHYTATIPFQVLNTLCTFCLMWGSKASYHSAVESFKKARA